MCLLSCMSAHVKTRTHARIHVRRENDNLILKIKDSSSEMAQQVRALATKPERLEPV